MIKPSRILIVEDDPRWQSLLAEILGQDGYLIDTARTYSEAATALKLHRYGLALVDIRLGEEPLNQMGMHVLDAIKQIGQEVNSIVLTAFGTVSLSRHAFKDYGVLDFIDKQSFDVQEFRKLVQETLSSLVYIVVQVLGLSEGVFAYKEEGAIRVFLQPQQPTGVTYASLSLPSRDVQKSFDLEVSVLAPEMELLPSSRQTLKVPVEDLSPTVEFRVIPGSRGQTEILVELYYLGRFLRKIPLFVEVL